MAVKIPHPVFGTSPVPLGRMAEWKLRERADADRIAIRTTPSGEYLAEAYASRAQLLMLTRKAEQASNRGAFRALIREG